MSILRADRTLVMGIVNATPDSFSDGGEFFTADAAVDHGLALIAQGADLIDVGGESTRPGSQRPSAAEELRRVVPVVEALTAAGVSVSVDTMRAEVARAVVEAGADYINDVSAGLADERMLPTVAELGVPYIAMHWRAHGDVMSAAEHTRYDNVVDDVLRELSARVDAALKAGVVEDNLILDPGIGFAKTAEHNWALLRSIDRFNALGFPCLVGVSRKRFLGELLREGQVDRPAKGRDAATAALTTYLAERDIWAVRTHEVRTQRDAVAVVGALRGAGER